MSPTSLIILLFAAGVLLVVAEVFLPSHGVLGVLGAIGLVAGVIVCLSVNQYLGLVAALTLVLLLPFATALWLKVWPHTPVGKRLILGPAERQGAATPPRVYVGQVGVVVSELRPGGVCEFGGSGAAASERIEARAEHGVIPAGRQVEVIAVVDHRPLVRAVA
jgi:membrane-bound ClpP family serine protease